MAGYIVAMIDVTDPQTYQEYTKQVPATIEKYGGRFIVRGGEVETLEGTFPAQRIVVLEFESVERARAWWASEEYRAPKALRQSASNGTLLLVAGA